MPTLTDRFTQRLDGLGSDGAKRFVHGVYKQVAGSHRGRRTGGEYRVAVDHLRSISGDKWIDDERIGFMHHLADALEQRGFGHHAQRLLHQENLSYRHAQRKVIMSLLDEIDPAWRAYVSVFYTTSGIEVDTSRLNADGDQKIEFIYRAADVLNRRGSARNARDILEEEKLSDAYAYWKYATASLDAADPAWREYLALEHVAGGVRLHAGGGCQGYYGISILCTRTSTNSEYGDFEAFPRFGGKTVEEMGLSCSGEVIDLPPADALHLARAVLAEDRKGLEAICDQYCMRPVRQEVA